MNDLAATSLPKRMSERFPSDSPDKSKLIQTTTNLRIRLQGMIVLMNAPTAQFDAPALRAEMELWVRDLAYTRLILEIAEGFLVPTASWEQNEVLFLKEWDAFLLKACMALIDEHHGYHAVLGRH